VSRDEDGFEIGKAIVLRQPGEAVIISTGILASRALKAAEILENDGIACGVVNMHTLKPLDEKRILDLGRTCRLIATVEEHFRIGGLGSAIAEVLTEHLAGPVPKLVRIGLPDAFVDDYGSQDHLFERYGLQPSQIAKTIRAAHSTMQTN
jgi:transketolase